MLNTISGLLGAPLPPLTYSQTVLADSPRGFWLLDETSGSTATDLTANANNLSYVASPTLNVSTGLSGVTTGVTYNGTTQYANSSKVSTFNMSPDSSWSIEGWFRTTSSAVGTVLMFREDTSTNAGIGAGLFVNLTTGKISAFSADSTSANLVLTSSTTVNTGSWFYACVTAASGGAMTLYVNGASEASTSTTRYNNSVSRIVSTGAQAQTPPTYATFLTGSTAAIAIYDTTLSSTRVLAHYNAGI
jgi:hypothetical protein